jgi:hypothetical protein
MKPVLKLSVAILGTAVVCGLAGIFIKFDEYDGEDYIIEQGECCGLRIGQNRQEVAAALQNRGIDSVRPVDATHIAVRRHSAGRIDELRAARGICSGDNRGYGMQVRFDAQERVDHVVLSVPAEENEYGLAIGQSKDLVLARFREALARQPGLVVSNCLPDTPDIHLRTSPLYEFDAWFYYEPESFSYGTVIFTGDRLSRIEYHHRPHEQT